MTFETPTLRVSVDVDCWILLGIDYSSLVYCKYMRAMNLIVPFHIQGGIVPFHIDLARC